MIPAHAGPTARTVASGVLVAVAVAASMLSLTSIVVPGAWTRAGLLGILLVSATTVTSRVMIGRRARARGLRAKESGSAWPSVLGAVVAAWFVLARYGGPTADPTVVITPEHVSRVVARLGEAGEIARSEVAPVTGSVPIGLLTVGGTLLVLLLADALAGALRRPALVGLPLLALWAPPLVLTGRVPWGVFVVTVTALLLLLTLDGPLVARARRAERTPAPVRRAERSRAVATTAGAVVLAVVAGLVGTASAALPGGPAGWYRTFTTTGDTIRLAEDLDILRSLTERSSSVVLSYDTGSDADVGPLRSYTATAFDGRRWQRGEERGGREFAERDVLWPEDLPPGAQATRKVAFEVGELRDDKLPISIDPRQVSTDAGGWGYDPARDEVVGGLTDTGDAYTLTVHERDLDPDVLREAPAADLDEVYTQVPESAHAADVEAAAREVVGDADTVYDQAVDLQRWLRDPTRFTYSTTIPRGGTGDPVWDFLQHRTGYCIQFATTMVVMARSLGIPARLAVGYLPGDRTGETTWRITGQDSHAWPEIYFPGTGWVRFEPTPAQQTGSPPAYTTALAQGGPTAVPTAASDLGERRPTAGSTPTDDAATPSASTAASLTPVVDTGLPAWVWITAGSLVVVLVGGLVLLLARRRRASQELDPELAWEQVLAALAAEGVRLPPATTLRRAPDAIAAAVTTRSGRELTPEVREDLASLARAAEMHRYAREPLAPEADELERLATAVTSGLGESLSTR
ncbi:transglutaminaseTgpA domain-containing protein [Isoptericola sp. NPDC019482]|uniref:transglutaminase family protein n=1 Tax=Isoptericola sp. NPDC019482 TaxID=3154688 RepID=UPI003477103A